MAKGLLEANGIPARLKSDQGGSARWDMHLFVRPADVKAAVEILPK